MAGSTMKVAALAAAIKDGFELEDTFEGNSPYELPDGTDVKNQGDDGNDYGSSISLITATENSVNTAFIDMSLGMDDGPREDHTTWPADLGIPATRPPRSSRASPRTSPGSSRRTVITLGNATVSPINMANAYATHRHRRRALRRPRDREGRRRHRRRALRVEERQRAPSTRTSPPTCPTPCSRSSRPVPARCPRAGSPAAGKTGTATNGAARSSSAWFAGYTPQMATAVMYVRGDGDNQLDGLVAVLLRCRLPRRDLDRDHEHDHGGPRRRGVPGAGLRRGRRARQRPRALRPAGDHPPAAAAAQADQVGHDQDPGAGRRRRPRRRRRSPPRRSRPTPMPTTPVPTTPPDDAGPTSRSPPPPPADRTVPPPTVAPSRVAGSVAAAVERCRLRPPDRGCARESPRRARTPSSLGQRGGRRAAGRPRRTHPWWTPLRVVLLLAASPCRSASWPRLRASTSPASGRPAATPTCAGRTPRRRYVANGFAEGYWPFTDDEQVRARYAPAWVPPLPAYVAFASQRVTPLLNGSPDLDARALVPVAESPSNPTCCARLGSSPGQRRPAGGGGPAGRRPADGRSPPPTLGRGGLRRSPRCWCSSSRSPGTCSAAASWPARCGAGRAAGPAWPGWPSGSGAAASPFVPLLLVPALALLLRDRRLPRGGRRSSPAPWSRWVAADGARPCSSSPAAVADVVAGLPPRRRHRLAWLLVSQVSRTGSRPTGRPDRHRGAAGRSSPRLVVVLASARGWSFAQPRHADGRRRRLSSARPRRRPYALVLLPLAVVAVRAWSHLLVWQACEIGHWALLGFYLGGLLAPSGGGDARAYWLAWCCASADCLAGVVGPRRARPDADPVDPDLG